jgi:hypothetical protein
LRRSTELRFSTISHDCGSLFGTVESPANLKVT